MRTEIVNVSPEMAAEWLTKSKINRNLREPVVTAYAEAMRRGDWHVTDQGLGFSDGGELVNGHHRLTAVVRSGVAVKFLVVRGINPEAKGAIDCGIGRSLGDRLRMFTSTDNIARRTSILRVCIKLAAGQRVRVITIDDYQNWLRHFSAGVEWAVTLTGGSVGDALFPGPVSGAMAFAYKSSPDMVAAFGERYREGSGLERNSPELTLRNFMASTRSVHSGAGERMAVSRKTLNAILAAIDGRSMTKLQDGYTGLTYFSRAYDSPSMKKLAKPWAEDAVQP